MLWRLTYSTAPQCLLKYCTARSCCFAFSKVEKVPRLRRLPVLAFFFLEYSRNSPDLSLRIMFRFDARQARSVAPVAEPRHSYLLSPQTSFSRQVAVMCSFRNSWSRNPVKLNERPYSSDGPRPAKRRIRYRTSVSETGATIFRVAPLLRWPPARQGPDQVSNIGFRNRCDNIIQSGPVAQMDRASVS